MIVLTWMIFVNILALCETICYYKNTSKTLTCEGIDIMYFPQIVSEQIQNYTYHINIYNTCINSLTQFELWPVLYSLEINNNKYLPCEYVFKLKDKYHVTSDCFKIKKFDKAIYIQLFCSIMIIIIVFLIIFIAYYNNI